jgi:glycosyltransferase involved in cell wall biosynthesis
MIDKNTNFFKYIDNFEKVAHIPSIPIFEAKLDRTPEITIAIPTYKRANLLKEAIDSAINQIDYTNYDILVVDNNPERECETEKLMISYHNPRISYYKNTQNIGMVGNWNRLFSLAKGKYVVMLHDDDMLELDYLKFLNQIFNRLNKEVDVIYFQQTRISENFNKKGRQIFSYLNALDIKPYDFLLGCITQFMGACFKRLSVLKLGGFSEEYYPSSDYEFNMRLSKHGFCVSTFGYPLVLYRILDNESKNTKTILDFIKKDKKIRDDILNLYPKLFNIFHNSYSKVYAYNYLKSSSRLFNNKDSQLLAEINKLYVSVSFWDKMAYKFIYYFIRILQKCRTYKLLK